MFFSTPWGTDQPCQLSRGGFVDRLVAGDGGFDQVSFYHSEAGQQGRGGDFSAFDIDPGSR